MKRFSLPRWGAWALAFALAVAGLLWLTARREGGTVRLSGGDSARVIGVTYGTNHVLKAGPVWARAAYQFGAIRWAHRLGYRRYSAPTHSPLPSLMVWVVFSAPPTKPTPRHASVAGGDGAETEPTYQAVVVSSPQAAETVAGWRFENFPRRERRMHVRLYEYDLFQTRGRREGELLVENPARVAKSPAPAPSAPVTDHDGPLECSLLALRGGEPPPLTARNSPAQWASAEFAFQENGQPTTAWTVKRFEALSATGNRISPLRPIVMLVGDRRVVRFPGPLWPDEPDWKVAAEFVRTRDFPAESLWTLRLPGACLASASFATNLTAEAGELRQSFLLQLQIGLPSGIVSSAPRQANLSFSYTPVTPDCHLNLARTSDDKGDQCLDGEPTTPRHGWLDARLKLPAAAAWLDLTFALHRSRKFTFQVRPALRLTNAAPAGTANTNLRAEQEGNPR